MDSVGVGLLTHKFGRTSTQHFHSGSSASRRTWGPEWVFSETGRRSVEVWAAGINCSVTEPSAVIVSCSDSAFVEWSQTAACSLETCVWFLSSRSETLTTSFARAANSDSYPLWRASSCSRVWKKDYAVRQSNQRCKLCCHCWRESISSTCTLLYRASASLNTCQSVFCFCIEAGATVDR